MGSDMHLTVTCSVKAPARGLGRYTGSVRARYTGMYVCATYVCVTYTSMNMSHAY